VKPDDEDDGTMLNNGGAGSAGVGLVKVAGAGTGDEGVDSGLMLNLNLLGSLGIEVALPVNALRAAGLIVLVGTEETGAGNVSAFSFALS